MTEERARTKWCPMRINNEGHRELRYAGDVCKCIASDCMMWRWDREGKGFCGLTGKL